MGKIILRENEKPKPIPVNGLDLYRATNFGRIFNNETKLEMSQTPRYEGGFLAVSLWNRITKKTTKHQVHIIIYKTFVNSEHDTSNKSFYISHIDKNKTNNCVDNLKCMPNKGGKHSAKRKPKRPTEIISDISQFEELGFIGELDFTGYKINRNGIVVNKKSKIRIQPENIGGYRRVGLTPKNYKRRENGRKITHKFLVHRLVGICFLKGGIEHFQNKKLEINHKDKQKNNNHVSNLEWVTKSENSIHKNETKEANVEEKQELSQEQSKVIEALMAEMEAELEAEMKAKMEEKQEQSQEKQEEIEEKLPPPGFKKIGQLNLYDLSNYYVNQEGVVMDGASNKKWENSHMNYNYNGARKKIPIGQIVAKVFFEDGDKFFADTNYVLYHKDRNKKNNHVSNLEWITKSERSLRVKKVSVIQIDLITGEELATYDSIKAAHFAVTGKIQKSGSLIGAICRGTQKSAYGYGWRYKNKKPK